MIGLSLGLTARRGGPPSWDFTGGTLPAGVTFTRAGSATYFDAAGVLRTAAADVPRFDHDPVTKAPKGLMIEGSRTNLLLRSEEFSDAAWSKGNSTIDPNSIAAPTGAMTADTLVASGTSIPFLVQGFSIASGTIYTASCFFKKKDVSRIVILFFGADFNSGGANLTTTFDLDAGSITAQGHTTATITNAGGGWYRCAVSHLATATKTATVQLCRFDGASTTSGFGTYVWGAQLEAGAFPSSYIPTTTAAATRAADTAVMTGTDFTRWFNPTEGSIAVDFSTFNTGITSAGGNGFECVFDIDSAAAPNNDYNLFQSAAYPGYRGHVNLAGVPQALFNAALPLGTGALTKYALAYKANDFAASYNGGAALVDAAGTLPPAPDRIAIGSTNGGVGSHLFGHFRRLRYWPTRLPNARLQEITA